ncbi:MAG: hypothetical protein KDD60_12210 [Bdellovibrionales bacterium]|nr:hypothetical protein [Bdellovibrionales bacterium]
MGPIYSDRSSLEQAESNTKSAIADTSLGLNGVESGFEKLSIEVGREIESEIGRASSPTVEESPILASLPSGASSPRATLDKIQRTLHQYGIHSTSNEGLVQDLKQEAWNREVPNILSLHETKYAEEVFPEKELIKVLDTEKTMDEGIEEIIRERLRQDPIRGVQGIGEFDPRERWEAQELIFSDPLTGTTEVEITASEVEKSRSSFRLSGSRLRDNVYQRS